MAMSNESMVVIAAFQRFVKTGGRGEIEQLAQATLERANTELGARDAGAAYRRALEDRIKELRERPRQRGSRDLASEFPVWVRIAGAAFSGVTLLFLMGLVVAATRGFEVPCQSRFLVVAVLGLGAALGSSFLGGHAAATGAVGIPYVESHPLQISVVGGVAVLVAVMTLGQALYGESSCTSARVLEACSAYSGPAISGNWEYLRVYPNLAKPSGSISEGSVSR